MHLRQSPTLAGSIVKRLQPDDRVQILEGPVQADGYTWWKMRVMADGIEGWAVQHPDWYEKVFDR